MNLVKNRGNKKAVIDYECVACGVCMHTCPLGAITIYKGLYAIVDEDKCIGCGKCSKACPASVISIKEASN